MSALYSGGELADATLYYFGMPSTGKGTDYDSMTITVPKTGVITVGVIGMAFWTAGTAEAWAMYLRNITTSTDYLIGTQSVSATKRLWTNYALNIPVTQGDQLVIKTTTPTWVTNPADCFLNAYFLIRWG
jgi:hypothetical protein